MQRLASQLRSELTLPLLAATGLHTLSPETIDEIINSAVARALHQATSAQSLTTPQSEPLRRQLHPTDPPIRTFPATRRCTAITGPREHQFAAQAMAPVPEMGYGWDASGGTQFLFPGIVEANALTLAMPPEAVEGIRRLRICCRCRVFREGSRPVPCLCFSARAVDYTRVLYVVYRCRLMFLSVTECWLHSLANLSQG